jgi:hypothetical protein
MTGYFSLVQDVKLGEVRPGYVRFRQVSQVSSVKFRLVQVISGEFMIRQVIPGQLR